MGLFKRLAGFLGFARDDEQHHHDDAAASDVVVPPSASGAAFASAQRFPMRGFSVPVQVPVERDAPPSLLVFCPAGDGEIQELECGVFVMHYMQTLTIEEDFENPFGQAETTMFTVELVNRFSASSECWRADH